LDFGRQRQSSPDWEEIETPEHGDTPATAPPASASTSPEAPATPGVDGDNGVDDDDLETPVRVGRNLLKGKRSATGKTPAPKRAKKEPISSQNSSALSNIAQHMLASNSQREMEFQERRPSWKRAWELIQDSYKMEWAKLMPGTLGCLHLVLSQCPANLSAQGSNVTYADLILAIGNDKRRDKYVRKVLKLATELQEEGIESSDEGHGGESDFGYCFGTG
jgi:hypothetical protein